MLPDLVLEEWRWVPGYEGRYAVSNRGRVYSYKGKGKYLKPYPDTSGHLAIRLFPQCIYRQVHSLVLEAFVGPCPADEERRHLNDDPSNNSLDNLDYGTHGQNILDRKWNGKQHGVAKLSINQVREIKAWLRMGMAQRELAKLFGVHVMTVNRIARGELHSDVT